MRRQTITYIDGPCKGKQLKLISASTEHIDVPVMVGYGPIVWLKYVRSGPREFRLSHECYATLVPAGCIQSDKPAGARCAESGA